MIWSREHGEVSDVNLTPSEKNWYVRGLQVLASQEFGLLQAVRLAACHS